MIILKREHVRARRCRNVTLSVLLNILSSNTAVKVEKRLRCKKRVINQQLIPDTHILPAAQCTNKVSKVLLRFLSKRSSRQARTEILPIHTRINTKLQQVALSTSPISSGRVRRTSINNIRVLRRLLNTILILRTQTQNLIVMRTNITANLHRSTHIIQRLSDFILRKTNISVKLNPPLLRIREIRASKRLRVLNQLHRVTVMVSVEKVDRNLLTEQLGRNVMHVVSP